ncbi:MAG: SMP-30/gluconolactonase/LRE family protein [Deltaproteobacteria bacterium]|uniref:SMP-30/gluconolactonase/LRE family protein n=1 Tax=Candidatus Zymogenus saltonus TaxID=2844893 RepID=A0A9D8KKA3_9DELT|nr:SMP-30/gluconolactonase/LRE family protein [Candidatus Zymogenus saltonus]
MSAKTKNISGLKVLLILLTAVPLCLATGCAKNIETEIPIDNCIRITGMPGPEDFAYIASENILVVSSDDRRNHEKDGKLFWIDLALPPEEQVGNPIDIEYPDSFKPHGVSYITTDTGGRLFVISHPNPAEGLHTVEVFDMTGSGNNREWKHVETLKSELYTSPNDLVALPDGTLFVSNDSGKGGNTIKKIKALFKIKNGDIIYYDGAEYIDFGNPESYGNGINYFKADGAEYLYRAALMDKSVKKYEIIRTEGKITGLKYLSKVDLGTMPDNLEIEPDGTIYAACHFNSFIFLKHAKDGANISPTQILVVSPAGEVKEIYANKGQEISAGSVGRVINGRLYIGQVFEGFLLSCPCCSE